MTDSQSLQTFKMDQKISWVVPAMFLMSGILPAMSLFELLTTGTIDMDAVGRGRARIPTWILYLIAWPCFLFFWVPFAWWVRNLWQGHVFRLEGDRLIVGRRSVLSEDVAELRTHWFGCEVTLMDGKRLWFAPWFSSDGSELLSKKFSDKWW